MDTCLDRFAYEEAEVILDSYAMSDDRGLQFRRAYKKFKFAVHALAYVDFAYGERPDGKSLSYAWEDVQVAFSGYGEPSMTGVIINLWTHVPKNERNLFERVVHDAFRAAESKTPEDLPRRYLSRWRRKPVRRPEQGFTLPTIIPINGPRLKDWVEDTGQDYEEIEERLYWLELADRHVRKTETDAKDLPAPPKSGPFLQLVPDPTT